MALQLPMCELGHGLYPCRFLACWTLPQLLRGMHCSAFGLVFVAIHVTHLFAYGPLFGGGVLSCASASWVPLLFALFLFPCLCIEGFCTRRTAGASRYRVGLLALLLVLGGFFPVQGFSIWPYRKNTCPHLMSLGLHMCCSISPQCPHVVSVCCWSRHGDDCTT